MKKTILLVLALFVVGCAKNETGPTGPQGPSGPGAPGELTTEFETGVYPDSGYPNSANPLSSSGCYPHWLDASNPTNPPTTGEIRIATAPTVSGLALGLVRFNLSYGIPVNATIQSCTLELTTKTTSSFPAGTTFVVGIHQFNNSSGNDSWYSGSTWDNVTTGVGWDGSGSPVSIVSGFNYSSTPMDAVTVTATQITGNQVLLGWNVSATLAQTWLDPAQNGNNGVLLSFEPQINSAAATISFWDNTGSSQQKPKMLVNYTVQ